MKLGSRRMLRWTCQSLRQVKWRVNTSILDMATEAWDKNLEVGDLPKRPEIPYPEAPPGLVLNPNGIVKIANKEDMEDPEMVERLHAFRRSVKKVRAPVGQMLLE